MGMRVRVRMGMGVRVVEVVRVGVVSSSMGVAVSSMRMAMSSMRMAMTYISEREREQPTIVNTYKPQKYDNILWMRYSMSNTLLSLH